MSMRFIPSSQAPASFSHIDSRRQHGSSAPSAPGIHDTLRHGIGPGADYGNSDKLAVASSAHPLEARLRGWEATQEAVRMESLRRAFGMGEPIRRGMELKVVRDGAWRPLCLGPAQPCLHEDILRGRDDTITWEDVFDGQESRTVHAFHDEMEKKCKV